MDKIDSYDLIIDARSPKEFELSRIPNAKNYYALNDEEHQEIGTMHKVASAFEARVKGAKYVCVNAALHIDSLYPAFKPNAKIAIYCARGGMRSYSLAVILSSIGYRIDRISGGYKSYRNFVLNYLENFEKLSFITLRGLTGCGKSELIQKLPNSIDLEKLSNHYGSVFGAVNGIQPTQKHFENLLVDALMHIDSKKPVFIEGESKRIGKIVVPSRLFEMISSGYEVRINAPLEERLERILNLYENISDNYFYFCMDRISPYIKKSSKDEIIKAYGEKNIKEVVKILLVEYYDTVYKKQERIDLTIDNQNNQNTLEILKNLQKNLKAQNEN